MHLWFFASSICHCFHTHTHTMLQLKKGHNSYDEGLTYIYHSPCTIRATESLVLGKADDPWNAWHLNSVPLFSNDAWANTEEKVFPFSWCVGPWNIPCASKTALVISSSSFLPLISQKIVMDPGALHTRVTLVPMRMVIEGLGKIISTFWSVKQ